MKLIVQVRQAFTADVGAGNTLVVADYGQLELRLLAHMANCESMLRAFELGGDFHSRTALGMYDHIKAAVAGGALRGSAGLVLACPGQCERSCLSGPCLHTRLLSRKHWRPAAAKRGTYLFARFTGLVTLVAGDCLLEWDEHGEGRPAPLPMLKDMFANERRKAKVRLCHHDCGHAIAPQAQIRSFPFLVTVAVPHEQQYNISSQTYFCPRVLMR